LHSLESSSKLNSFVCPKGVSGFISGISCPLQLQARSGAEVNNRRIFFLPGERQDYSRALFTRLIFIELDRKAMDIGMSNYPSEKEKFPDAVW
jgi:hypothetical protein